MLGFEQRAKCLAKFNETAAGSYRMLSEIYEEECLSRARVFEWHKRFCSAREDVEDDDRLGCSVTSVTVILSNTH